MYLQKMGLENHQAIGFIHTDKGHPHIHLVINRVDEKDFSLYNDSFVGKKSSKAADEIATEMGLTRASEIGREKLLRQQNGTTEELDITMPKGSKDRFKADLERILKQGHVDIDAYLKAVENDGYKVKKYVDRETGKLRGYGVERDGTLMNSSDIDRKLTINKLSFGNNKVYLENTVIIEPKPKISEGQKSRRRR